jgi:hypothetical protein
MKWIKTTERLPKIPKNDMCIRLLLYTDEGIYTGNFWDDGSWYVDCFGKVDVEEVLYWAPLPKPPKED